MTVSSSLATLCQKLCSSFNAQSGIRDRPDDHRAPALLSSKPWRCFDKKLKVECDDNEDASTTVETDTRVGSVSDLDFFSQPSSSSETHSGCEMPALPVHVEVATRTTQAAKLVRPWSTSGFEFVKPLQDARRNHGSVDLMQSLHDGSFVAAKRMPNWWMGADDDDFKKQQANSMERPWVDVGVVKYLESKDFPFVCKSRGIFRDSQFTYVTSSLAEDGDLFKWCDRGPAPGPQREAVLRPIVTQIISAVQLLHNYGIAHRDLSLENILMTTAKGGAEQIKLIDFGMATCSRQCCNESVGKKSYQAPETNIADKPYDPFLADCFALGVVIFALGAQDYPWLSTRKGACKMFDYAREHGFQRFIAARKVRKGNGERLKHVMSKDFVTLMEGLLSFRPDSRLTLGEHCWSNGATKLRPSVWDSPWAGQERSFA